MATLVVENFQKIANIYSNLSCTEHFQPLHKVKLIGPLQKFDIVGKRAIENFIQSMTSHSFFFGEKLEIGIQCNVPLENNKKI